MRLDHLLSKEPTARCGHECCPLPGSSYVEHWPMGGTRSSRPRRTSQPSSPEPSAGPSPAPPSPRVPGLHCSVLRKRPRAAGPGVRRFRLFAQPGRTGDASVELRSGPVVPPPRDARRLGRVFENCLASTSVLLITLWSSAFDGFSYPSRARGLCDFKLQRANGGCLGARCR